MHLSPELEWAQFLVIMVVGLMLLYDCVLGRKHARKLEGLLGPDGEELWESEDGFSSSMNVPTERSGGANLRFAVKQGQSDLASSETFLGGMEPPTYYPTLSADRDKHRAADKRKSDRYMAQYNTAFNRALKKGASPEVAHKRASKALAGKRDDAAFRGKAALMRRRLAKRAARDSTEGFDGDDRDDLESALEDQLRV